MALIYVDDIVVSESNTQADFVVRLSGASAGVITVKYYTSDGTADHYSDFSSISTSTLTFSPGETSKIVSVPITADTTVENTESFFLNLFTPTNASLAKPYAVASIVDNDTITASPHVSVADLTVDEKNLVARFVVKLGAASSSTVSVNYATQSGSATSGSDFTSASGTLIFAAGQTAKTVEVSLNDDATPEGLEQFGFLLSNASNAIIADGYALATIGISDSTVAIPYIKVDDVFASEDRSYVDVVVRLSAPTTQEVQVRYYTSDGTADHYHDYDAPNATTLVFAAGETSKSVRIPIYQDSANEGTEQFFFGLDNPVNATLERTYAIITLHDDDSASVSPHINVSDVTVDEKAGLARFIVSLDGASSSLVQVAYTTADDTATAGSDYTAANGNLVFNPGETVKTVDVFLTDDTTSEGLEQFKLNLSNAVNGEISDGSGKAVIGISDTTQVATPYISIDDVAVGEGDTFADFVIRLSAPSTQEVRVRYYTSDGTADHYYDYDAPNATTLVFAAGETSKSVRIPIYQDSANEGTEQFFFGLDNPVNAILERPYAVVTLVDNDSPSLSPRINVADVTVDEKDRLAHFVVTLDGASSSVVRVDYATADDSATAGSDYTAANGNLVFNPGETVKTVDVFLTDDTTSEGLEQFKLNLSNAVNGEISDGSGKAVIGISDTTQVATPYISIDDVAVGEGDTFADFVIRLSAPSTQEVRVRYYTSDGTADHYYDYDAPNATTLVFAAGETSKSVRIPIYQDSANEGTEQFFFGLDNPVNAILERPYAVVTLVDNDSPSLSPRINVADVTVDEKDRLAHFVVTLDGASSSVVRVDYATADDSATAGSDYTAANGNLVFNPGETVKTVDVFLTDDTTSEGLEQFKLNLSNAVNGEISDGSGKAVIGISDTTQVATPYISIDDVAVGEGDTFADFVIRLSAPSTQEVRVRYYTSDGTADHYHDYDAPNATTLVFAAGETSKSVHVPIYRDNSAEFLESFFFVLDTPVNANLERNYALATIVDGDTPSVSPRINVADITVDEKDRLAHFVVTLDGASSSVVRVDYATADDSATAGSDYTAANGNLVFNPGETVKTVDVFLTDDTTSEGLEQFKLNLGNALNGEIVDGIGVATIGASDAASVATPILQADDIVVQENAGQANFILRLSAPSTQEVKLTFTTTNGKATSSYDYVALGSNTVTFAPGETTKVVSVPLQDDAAAEVVESFYLRLSSVTNATLQRPYVMATLVDNDAPPEIPILNIGDAVMNEKDGLAVFSVILDKPYTSQVSIGYATLAETAVAGDDYIAQSGLLVFSPGEVVKSIAVVVNDDATKESAEKFNIQLSNPTNATLGDMLGTALIGASDGAVVATPILNVNDVIYSEADAYVELRLSLSAPSASNVSVTFTPAAGSANTSDYVSLGAQTVVFAPGETVQTTRIEISQDTTTDPDETFTVNFTASNASVADSSILVNLRNDDDIGYKIMRYGLGNDIYTVTSSNDLIIEQADEGIDLANASASYILPDNVENLTLLGTNNLNGTGNALDNLITANTGNNVLNGLDGLDTVSYANATSGVIVSLAIATPQVTGGNGSDTLSNIENLTGSDHADTLTGNAGANTLHGGAGNDTLVGGAGNDVFSYASTNNGNDTVYDFNFGDVIRIASADLSVRLVSGSGSSVELNQVQLQVAGGQTTLYIGTDETPGAEIAITLPGSYAPEQFILSGTDIRLNSPPVLDNPIAGQQASAGTLFSYQVPATTFSDIDVGDVLTYSTSLANGNSLPGWLSFDASMRTFSGTASVSNLGSLELRVTATDKSGASNHVDFVLEVVNNSQPLIGTSGNDNLSGTAGSDTIDGRAGTDTVNYLQKHAAYSIGTSSNDKSVNGPEGFDTLTSIERLHFTDANLAFDTDGNAGQVYRLYKAAFARTPDLPGLGGWIGAMDNGTTLNQVANAFVGSDEFKSLYGTTTSNEEFVTLLYLNVMGRAPDVGGLGYWANQIATGTMTRVQVLTQFSESNENKATVVAKIAAGILYATADQTSIATQGLTLTGTTGADSLIGSVGPDRLTGLGGNDSISGGAGIDTALYSGARADYIVSVIASGLSISGGTEGTDTLTNVERLKFSDGGLAFDVNGNAGQVYRLYQAAFDRTPDTAGLSDWIRGMDQGMTLQKVATGFIGSAEFQGLYGANPTDEAFVNLLYQNVLNREPDAGGEVYWLDELDRGMTREMALIGFSESAENQVAVIGVIQDGIEFIPG